MNQFNDIHHNNYGNHLHANDTPDSQSSTSTGRFPSPFGSDGTMPRRSRSQGAMVMGNHLENWSGGPSMSQWPQTSFNQNGHEYDGSRDAEAHYHELEQKIMVLSTELTTLKYVFQLCLLIFPSYSI